MFKLFVSIFVVTFVVSRCVGQPEPDDFASSDERPLSEEEEKLPADQVSSSPASASSTNVKKKTGHESSKKDDGPDKEEGQVDQQKRTSYTEDRFNQWFNPRKRLETRRRVVPKYNIKPKPTLPSFIKNPQSVAPVDFGQPASRNISPKPSTTPRTTPSPRNRVRNDFNNFNQRTSSSSTTTAPRRNFTFATRRSSGGRIFLRNGYS